MIRAVLFDLDGTLLPMDQDVFVKSYFSELCAFCAPHGYEPEALVRGIWEGMAAMTANDGRATNEEVFRRSFTARFGERSADDFPLFDRFYEGPFGACAASCGYTPRAREVLDMLHANEVKCVLATNPVFPLSAQKMRMQWAGISPSDFEFVTSYDVSHFAKPNPAYYTEILGRLGLGPDECRMVGNDTDEDMGAANRAGIRGFLLTDCLIDRSGTEGMYPRGGYDELVRFLREAMA